MGDATTALIIAADTAAGVIAATVLLVVAQQYVDLADDYHQLYRSQRDFYYNNFQVQGEAPLNAEVYNVPFYVPLYDSTGAWLNNGVTVHSSLYYYRPQAFMQANTVFTNTLPHHLLMFNSNLFLQVPALFELSEISDDWATYFYRYEEHRRDVYNAQRYARQMDSLSFGIKEGTQIERGLATSFAQFDESQGKLVSSMDNIVDDVSAHIGYVRTIREQLEIPKAKPDGIMRSNFDTSAGP